MITREFFKMHGLENHVAIFDATHEPFKPDRELIQQLCSVNTGIGAEQIVVISQSDCVTADYKLVLYNPDGMIAQACGNATRCAAKLLMDKHEIDTVSFEIAGRTLHCKVLDGLIEVSMGKVEFDWQAIPLSYPEEKFHKTYQAHAVNVGNPHIVLVVDDMDEATKIDIGTQVQNHPALVESANIGFMTIVSDSLIRLQVFERPGVLTRACGSGACAAVAVAQKYYSLPNQPVTVLMPGGDLVIEFKEDQVPYMLGPASYSYRGFIQDD